MEIMSTAEHDAAGSKRVRIAFEPDGRVVEGATGRRLIDIARGGGIGIAADCGGRGKCGKCRVAFLQDSGAPEGLSKPSPDETGLSSSNTEDTLYRLACRTRVYQDVTVLIPEASRAFEGSLRNPTNLYDVALLPAVSRIDFEVKPLKETGEDRPFMGRVAHALSKRMGKAAEPVSLGTMAAFCRESGPSLPETLTATLARGRRVIQLRPGRHTALYGVALDIGTTSIAAFLCDLENGNVVGSATSVNPQRRHGADVISRIARVQKDPSHLRTLQKEVLDAQNRLIRGMARDAGVERENILDVVAVGNPTMQHLFLGLNPVSIGGAPYLPICFEGGEVKARDLGLWVSDRAHVHVLPMISGFVGGDTIAALLTGSPSDFEGVKLMADVGTNGELVLSRDGTLLGTSCATGPAFEGAQITCGMLAASGAIEKVWMDSDDLHYSVIGRHGAGKGIRASGLCGSGVISAVSTLVSAGIVQKSGAFDLAHGHPGLRKNPKSGVWEMIIAPASDSAAGEDIVLSQEDIRSVQVGKAALAAGAELLMREAGVTRLDGIFLAGTFGNYLDPDDLVRLGMLSPGERQTVEPIGNAAGDGARLALFNREKRRQAREFAERIRVLELSMRPEFQEIFIDAIGF